MAPVAAFLLSVLSAPGARETLFASAPAPSPSPCPDTVPTCPSDLEPFTSDDLGTKNKVFDQLTVAEQLTIEGMMAPMGVSFEAWNKCRNENCSTIAKIALKKPPKSEVLAYFAGGPKPKRIATFWWLQARLRIAQILEVEMPIGPNSMPTVVRTVPWENRPFVYWDQYHRAQRNALVEPLLPLMDPIVNSLIPSPSMLASLNASGETWSPRASVSGGATSVPGSTTKIRQYLGRIDIRAGHGANYFKEGPVTFVMEFDWDTEELVIKDISWCPGAGNPIFNSVAEVLAANEAGTLKMCTVDTVWYGDTKAWMEPEPPFVEAAIPPQIYYPEGPRFSVSGRTVSWMGWDFHTDIHAIEGIHISNLRFKGERIAYEMYAADFTAVYSGASTRKDIFYSDGGYEMGNCAITLREGLQCPYGSVFMKSLGYANSYVWGGALSMDDELPTMCIFEAPANNVAYQHYKEKFEGVALTSLYVRSILTVGNYDYVQTFELEPDGKFNFYKQLTGYAVGSYVIPGNLNNDKMAEFWGAKVSESSLGAMHTHSVSYKIDLDIAGLENSFMTKKPGYKSVASLLEEAGEDPSQYVTAADNSFYMKATKITSEGFWDNDGDSEWTPPEACLSSDASTKFIVYSPTQKNYKGNKRGYKMSVPGSPPVLYPEGDPYLHIQNFTKCDIGITKYSPDDLTPAGQVVFGNLYPEPAAPGTDISHFYNGESLEEVDIVLYAHSTKMHWVVAEDVPVPSTMGKELAFEPYNYFDYNQLKNLPTNQYVYPCAECKRGGRTTEEGEGGVIPTCTP